MSELEKVNLMLREQLEEMSTRLANVTDMSSVASPPVTPSTAVPAANTAPQSPSHGKERPSRIQMEERKQWYIGAIVHLTRLEKLQAQDTKPTTIRIPEGCSQPEGLHDALIPESTASTAMECNAPKEDLWRHYKPRGFTEVNKSMRANSTIHLRKEPRKDGPCSGFNIEAGTYFTVDAIAWDGRVQMFRVSSKGWAPELTQKGQPILEEVTSEQSNWNWAWGQQKSWNTYGQGWKTWNEPSSHQEHRGRSWY